MLEVILGLVSTALIASVGFVVQANSRLTIIETRHEDIMELIKVRFDSTDFRLGRIEKCMNGALHAHDKDN